MRTFTLMRNEQIIWRGRQSFWGSGAAALLFIGFAFMLVSVSLLHDAFVLTLFGLFLVFCSGYLLRRFRIYIITNKRFVELKAGEIVREVYLDQIVKTYDLLVIENVLDLVSMLLGRGPVKGLIPTLLGVDNLYVKDADGKTVFVFRRVRVKKVREKVAEALRKLIQ
ncbi:MAG: hypothetical protein ACTSXW_01535 [Candidatus Baldrarchaeia archaeon]